CALLSDSLSDLHLEGFDEIYFLATDLDDDGLKEIWISPKEWANGVVGNMWYVFRQTSSGYERIQEIPIVRPDAFRVAEINGEKIIVNVWRGGAGVSSVSGIIFRDGLIEHYDMGEI